LKVAKFVEQLHYRHANHVVSLTWAGWLKLFPARFSQSINSTVIRNRYLYSFVRILYLTVVTCTVYRLIEVQYTTVKCEQIHARLNHCVI